MFSISFSQKYVLIVIMSELNDTIDVVNGIMEDNHRPDYMNERVFQRNRLPPRAYFLPPEHLSLSGKWRFHYASSPLEPEPGSVDDGAWDLIDVPGKPVTRLFRCCLESSALVQLVC